MSTCANCENDALYVYEVNNDLTINYCDKDLPGFLKARREAGTLPTTEAYAKLREDALAALTPIDFTRKEEDAPKPAPKKAVKKKPSIEDIVEETVVEIETVEEAEAVAEDAE